VDHGSNLEECIAALEAALDIEVEGHADASCEGSSCEADAGGSLSCAVDRANDVQWAVGAALFVLLFSIVAPGRSRREHA
jgi:hypothetical protein